MTPEDRLAERDGMSNQSRENGIKHVSYGKVYFDQGKIKQALEEFRVALIHDPENANILKHIGRCLFETGSLNEAAQALERAVSLKPEFPDLHYDLGCIYIKLNHPDRARNELREALNVNPSYEAARKALQELDREAAVQAESRLAERLLRESDQESTAKTAMVHYNLANALVQRNLLREAEAELHEAVSLKPNYPDLRNRLGEVYMKMGRFEEAETHLNEALKINPNYQEAIANLAETHWRDAEEKLIQAERLYAEILAKDPENRPAKLHLERIRQIKNLDIV